MFISKKTVIEECRKAIKNYDLINLLKTSFEKLQDFDKENAIAGLIQLGEALTFCRDGKNSELKETGIIEPARILLLFEIFLCIIICISIKKRS